VRIPVEVGGEWADDARPLSGVDGRVNPRLDLGRVLPAVAIIAFWIWLTRRMFLGRRLIGNPGLALLYWISLVVAGVLVWNLLSPI